MKTALEGLVANYPSHPVTTLAQDILNHLNGDDSSILSGDTTISASSTPAVSASLYKPEPDAIHLFVMVADIANTNVNALKIRISDFDQKYYSLQKLTVSSLFLDDDYQMITVSNFKTKADAMKYYVAIKDNAYVNSQLENSTINQFVISVGNYPVFYKDKKVSAYMKFFQSNYLR